MIRSGLALGSGILMAATPVKVAETATDPMPTVYVKKPSELPLYTPLHESDPRKKSSAAHCHEAKRNAVEEGLDEGFRTIRTETNKVLDVVAANKESFNKSLDNLKAETKFMHDYLNKEENKIPRAGAVILGGMSGVIMGIRGGIFRKLFYGLIGTGVMGSICYPKEAEEVAQKALVEAKKGVNVAVNFAYGVQPGDPAPPIKWEESVSNAYKTVTSFIFPEK